MDRPVPCRPRCRIAAVIVFMLLAACGAEDDSRRVPLEYQPTFSRDVAPIVFEHCAACHQPGGIAPFSVLTYEDILPYAARIAQVTRDRIMPPWLPEPGYGTFINDLSLGDDAIEVIGRWVEAGAPEGDPAYLPERPRIVEGWQLGQPDLVVEISEPYTLPADTSDIFRNFVVPIPIVERRYVRAIEFRPIAEAPHDADHDSGHHGSMPVHHAVILLDPTHWSRRMDARDPEPGFEGMGSLEEAQSPSGFILGWAPGRRPEVLPEGMAWPLEPGTDLLLNLHMQPTGRPEKVRAEVGLYFTDRPPTRFPTRLLLTSLEIDIPAGQRAHVIEDTYELPVDVDVLAVYPHLHFLGREVHSYAILPDGSRQWLIRIDDWDFNWQDGYRYASPISLPAGSVLHMRITYDNSASNPHNPTDPPRRVLYGPESTDEMAEVWLQVLTRNAGDRAFLERDLARKQAQTLLEGARFGVRVRPDDADAHYRLGTALFDLGSQDEAEAAFRRAIALRADLAEAHVALGELSMAAGETEEAIHHFRRASELDPDFAPAHYVLAGALHATGDRAGAEAHLRRAVELWPDYAEANLQLGHYLLGGGRAAEASTYYRAALDAMPSAADPHVGLGLAMEAAGRVDDAIGYFRQAIALEPNNAQAHYVMGRVLYDRGQAVEAVDHLRTSVRLDPSAPSVLARLAWILATHPDGRLRNPQEALGLATEAARRVGWPDPDVVSTLAAALASAGRFEEAVAYAREAQQVAAATGNEAQARNIAQHIEVYRQGRPLQISPRGR